METFARKNAPNNTTLSHVQNVYGTANTGNRVFILQITRIGPTAKKNRINRARKTTVNILVFIFILL
jgi:hypothetical protein